MSGGWPENWFRNEPGRGEGSDPEATQAMRSPPYPGAEADDATQVIRRPPVPEPADRHTAVLPVIPAGRPPAARGTPAPPPAPAPAPMPPVGRRRRFRLGRALAALPLLLLLYLLVLLALVATSLQKTDAFAGLRDRPASAPGETWLLVGSDSRAGLSKAERKRLRTGSSAGRRTDTIMLLRLPASGRPTLVSLPRDSYVDVAGRGPDKLNAAYSIGGAPLLVRTVEDATGLRIDHYMEIGFAGVVDVTDAVGGADVCVPSRIEDAKSGLQVKKGCQELDGATSLAYVRARYFDAKGDLGRIERQQQWLGALSDRIASPGVLLNPVAHVRLARAGTDAVTVDEDTGVLDLLGAARAMRTVSGGGGKVTTVPVADPDFRSRGQSFVRWDEAKADALFDRLRGS